MKKTKKPGKKLLLAKEKVRDLNPTDLGGTAGGDEATSTSWSSSNSGSVRTSSSSWSKIHG